jgi:small subunit ribosomal protein S3
MSHKVHPKAYRIKEITDWSSRGFYKRTAENLEEDFRIREFLGKKFKKIGIEKIEIERFPNKLNVIIFSSRPGIIIGRGGEGIEQLKRELLKKVFKLKTEEAEKRGGKNFDKSGFKEVKIEIKEIRNPWLSAALCAQWAAWQIEKRVNHRRVLKQVISKIMANKEVKGAKIEVSGRLNGAEIARREWLKKGRLPLQSLRADIDYAKAEAYCTYGAIGIKVWIYKGEKF